MVEEITRETFNEVMVPLYLPADFIPVRGIGSRIWDKQGKDYIDFTGGIAVNSLGHAHPAIIQTLMKQAKKLFHIGNGYTSEAALRLATQLTNATFAEKVFFCNSGAEANEAALKLARKYSRVRYGDNKSEIIAFDKAFHGRTLFTVSAGGQPKYSQDFQPLPPNITHLPYNNLQEIKTSISKKTCAVIVEPILGEGGILPASFEFLQELRRLCDQHNVLLILDEVQTGVGRTGKLYAYMHYGIVPDILTTAKSLGGGFPIAAMLTTTEIASVFQPGLHGSTFGGNPLATAVAGTVFSIVNTPEILDGVQLRHDLIKQGLDRINQCYNLFSGIRGLGLLIGAVMKPSFSVCAKKLVQLGIEEGVMVLVAGPDVLRFAPALNIKPEEIEQGINRLMRAAGRFLD